MPNFSYQEVCRKIKRKGFFFLRNAKGSHEIWINAEGTKIVLPNHRGNIPTGTLSQIVKRSGFENINDFSQF